MVTKLFEVRDRMTFMPMLAVKMEVDSEAIYSDTKVSERYLLGRAGYQEDTNLVVLHPMEDAKASYDVYSWGSRTLTVAHKYITDNFDTLVSGSVIDVEFILGETKEPKKSERLERWD